MDAKAALELLDATISGMKVAGLMGWAETMQCRRDELADAIEQAVSDFCVNLLHDYFAAMRDGRDFDWVEQLRAKAGERSGR
jgi:hypothetical protein